MERIERLTRLNVEIEGLLRVLSTRDNSTVREMLNEKYSEFSALFCELMSEMPEDEEKVAVPVISEAVATETDEEKEAETAEVNNEPETEAEPESTEESATSESNEEPDLTDEIDEPISQDEIMPIELGEFPIVNEPVKEPVNETIAEQHQPEPETNDKTPTEPENTTLGERLSEEMPSEIRVDEMIARRTAGDLTKAFTLNDKIRFRRSLFASDADKFAKVLSDLSDIDTYRQATKFLADVLGWDLTNPEVEEFLSIIRPHYAKAD